MRSKADDFRNQDSREHGNRWVMNPSFQEEKAGTGWGGLPGSKCRSPQAAGKLGPGDKPAALVTWEAEAREMTEPSLITGQHPETRLCTVRGRRWLGKAE